LSTFSDIQLNEQRSIMSEPLSILLCEDEVIIALDIKFQLRKMGYFVTDICKNAEELIQKAKETKPDFIVTDIKLEGDMTGIEAMKVIKEELEIPFVYLSGQQNITTYQEAMKTNPCDFIGKPFSPHQLKNAIERCSKKNSSE
jgi:DNA-binding NtrC family response regulator